MHRPALSPTFGASPLRVANTDKEGRSKVVGIIGLLVTLILIILLLRLL
jgi:hypothetical protein